FQKLVRTGFGSNNVDHCTRLCHASSVAALMEGINSGAVSNQVRDVMKAEVARHATYNLQFKADTDVALLNAMLNVIVTEGLVNEAFIRDRTSGYEALAENVRKFTP